MTAPPTSEPGARRPLRLWPGVALVTVQWLGTFVLPLLVPEARLGGILTGLLAGPLVLLWWAFFSHAPRSERFGGVALILVALFGTYPLLDVSVAKGAQGMLFALVSIPVISLAFVGWAVATRRLSDPVRRLTMVVAVLVACLGWTLVRTGGFTGEGENDFAWRWSETPEQKLLAAAAHEVTPVPVTTPVVEAPAPTVPAETKVEAAAAPVEAAPAPEVRNPEREASEVGTEERPVATASATQPAASWPGFRGPDRNGAIPGVRIRTDWAASPPTELWRRAIGPGWSSFAVRGDLLYTQEQRGEDELVACYRVSTGEPVWMHKDPARFWESNGGAGPRGTPTLSGNLVFSFGGTGILNALNAEDGSVVWSRHAPDDTGAKQPGWGFSSSPAVVDDVVIVATSGILAAYDRATGEPRWTGPKRRGSYSSPQLFTLEGVTQILQMSGTGLTSVAPADGTVLWEHSWEGAPIVQPAVMADGSVVISTSGDMGALGTRRLAVAHGASGWTAAERWTSNGLKPYFNDFVIHKGHAFGFDGSILACINLEDGKRAWKGGRYGNGQMLLLPAEDLLLVLSEQGDLALVSATPDGFHEVARVPAIKGKTWNHPVLVGDVLLVRNAEEMAAFRLALDRR